MKRLLTLLLLIPSLSWGEGINIKTLKEIGQDKCNSLSSADYGCANFSNE